MSQECMQTFVLVYGDETSGEDDSETAFRRGGRLVNLPTPWSLLSALEPSPRRGNETPPADSRASSRHLHIRRHTQNTVITRSQRMVRGKEVAGADVSSVAHSSYSHELNSRPIEYTSISLSCSTHFSRHLSARKWRLS